MKWNPFSVGYFDDPYPHLSQCRQHSPIQETPHGVFLVLDYGRVQKALRNPGYLVSDLPGFLKSKEPVIFNSSNDCPYLSRMTSKWPMYLHGDEHKQIRSLMGKVFSLMPIQSILEESIHITLEEYTSRNTFNLVDFGNFFIFQIIKRMFRLPDKITLDQVVSYSNALSRSQDLYVTKKAYREINTQMVNGISWFRDYPYWNELKEIGASISLSEDDLYSMCGVSLMAAFETSKDNLNNGIGLLMLHPERMEQLKNIPKAELENWIEEIFRLSTPLQYTQRITQDPIQGWLPKDIPSGSTLMLSLASANRDPDFFPNPNEFWPERPFNDHLAFGAGSHFCLGSWIARQELRQALQPIAHALFSYRVKSKPVWAKQIFLRSLHELTISKD